MTERALLASSPNTIVLERAGRLYLRRARGREETPIDLPPSFPKDRWLLAAVAKWGAYYRIIGPDGEPGADLRPGEFIPPGLVLTTLPDGETVFQVRRDGPLTAD